MNMNIISSNKKATFDYNIEKTLEVGVELKGWEVKSIRMYGVSLNNTYISIINNEMFWKESSLKDPIGKNEPKRMRKILIHKRQINKWYGEMTKGSLTIIPLNAYWKYNRYFKLSIGLCSKSKEFHKKQKIKERDILRNERKDYIIK